MVNKVWTLFEAHEPNARTNVKLGIDDHFFVEEQPKFPLPKRGGSEAPLNVALTTGEDLGVKCKIETHLRCLCLEVYPS